MNGFFLTTSVSAVSFSFNVLNDWNVWNDWNDWNVWNDWNKRQQAGAFVVEESR